MKFVSHTHTHTHTHRLSVLKLQERRTIKRIVHVREDNTNLRKHNLMIWTGIIWLSNVTGGRIWVKLSIPNLHIIPLTCFLKQGALRAIIVLVSQNKFCPYFLHFSSGVDKVRYRRWPQILLNHFEIRESRHSESPIF